MSNNILSGNRELHLTPIELDLNTLYHPPKQPLTALGSSAPSFRCLVMVGRR